MSKEQPSHSHDSSGNKSKQIDSCVLKGIVHPKMEMSSFTHTHAVSNPYDDFSKKKKKKHPGRGLFNKTKLNEDYGCQAPKIQKSSMNKSSKWVTSTIFQVF